MEMTAFLTLPVINVCLVLPLCPSGELYFSINVSSSKIRLPKDYVLEVFMSTAHVPCSALNTERNLKIV